MIPLRKTTTLIFALLLCAAAGCAAREEAPQPARGAGEGSAAGAYPAGQAPAAKGGGEGGATFKPVSLAQTESAQPPPATPAARKIIRNATLTVEVESPGQALPRVTSLAEALGGYVVSSEARQAGGSGNVKPHETVTVQLRVPAAGFDEALKQVRAVGSRVVDEKATGQDVTEEYIDLEARVRTQRALEAQYLEIMKGSETVAEALEVQKQLAEVRTEIERVEGRRRFLESQVSFSTITVTLVPPAALVSASGFFGGLKDAFGDGLDIAVTVTLGLLRVGLALLPVLLFLVLPVVLLVRYLLRRRRPRVAE